MIVIVIGGRNSLATRIRDRKEVVEIDVSLTITERNREQSERIRRE